MPAGTCLIDVRLVESPVTVQDGAASPGPCGGECVFLGRTRAETHPDHGALRALYYEAYRPMAERTLIRLAEDAADRFGCHAIRLHHALGSVAVGEASVLVQTLTGHRAEAFESCRFLIDALKTDAPIWKREEWEQGATWSPGTPVSEGTPK